jgi:hypothetical protein
MGNTISDYLDHFPINWSQCATNDSADDAKTVQQTVLFGDPSLKIGGYENGDNPGQYLVRVKAWLLDTEDNLCEETGWSDPLTVTMPRNKIVYNTLLLRFLERFPILQKILIFIL